MSEVDVHPVAEAAPGLTQWQRVVSAFSAPTKTFTDIKDGHTSWWLPFLLFIVVGTALWGTVTVKVGWLQVAENAVKMSPKAADAMDKLPPEDRQARMNVSAKIQNVIWALAPAGVLLLNLIATAVLFATVNFGFGGKATFGKVLAVTWYAGLPGLIKLVIGACGLLAGVAPDAFVPGNPAGTNLGYYMNPLEANKALYNLATAIDPISIWTMVLLSIGLSIVAGTKKSTGYIVVFGWWVLSLIAGVAFAAAFS